ncbi:hypothetical protein ABZ801_19975 [Actinomadura sp. NPDC047616]|uniref:hypothetical protein n=1 Tax=Actinomadura sp. NPDC047616 TaxID=3155914 RepID=UPI0033E1AFE2
MHALIKFGGVGLPRRADQRPNLADVERSLGLLDRLASSGKSVFVIERHQADMAHAHRSRRWLDRRRGQRRRPCR